MTAKKKKRWVISKPPHIPKTNPSPLDNAMEEGTPLSSAMKTIDKVIKTNAEVIKTLEDLSSKKAIPNIPPSEMALYHLDKARAEILKMQKGNTSI